ncbi:MAG: hypothetical protein IJG05_06125 [Solobacterium sp.]|nr:hypothetical protein [Solobacterium sp.]
MMRKTFRTAAALLLLLRTAVLPETEPEETAQTETVQETAEPEETPAEEPVEETVQEPEEPEEAPPEETAAEPEESTDPEEVPEPVITHGTYAPLFTYGHMTIRNHDRPKLRAGVVPEHTCFYWIPSIGRYIGLINNTAVCLKHNSPGGANVSAMGDLESLLYEQGYSEFGYLMKGGDRNAFIGMLYNPVPHDPEGFAALQVTVWGDDTLTGYPCDIFGRNIDYSTAVQIVPPMNDPRHPYYKTYEVEYDRHTYDGHNWKYINLPMEDIANMAIASLKDSTKLYTSYDVGKQFDRKRGYLDIDNYDYGTLFGTSFPMNKADRIATFDSGSTHAMTLTAVDLDADGKPLKWKVENSWGSDSGQNGCVIMTNKWFNEYMFRLVVDKKYVPQNILQIEQMKPVMLPPEDPLFQHEE